MEENSRAINIVTLIPIFFTFVSNVTLIRALCRSRFSTIFLSVCGTIIAAIVWLIAFIAMLTNFSAYRLSTMVFFAPGIALMHCELACIALNLEWDPDYDSFLRMFKRFRR